MAKKKQIRNVLCFLVMIVILMSVMSVSAFAVNDGDNSSGDCAPVPDADLPEIYLNDTQECVLSSDSSNDTNIIILADISDDTRETVSALGCDVYVKIDDPCCKGYKVYVDGVYQFTEGQGKTPDGYCAFDVSAGKHTLKITKNGRSASKTNYFQCGNTYRWVSMPYCWCENGGSDDCKNPPTVKFDKTKYYEGDTVHATVSTSQSSVYYKIKDCGGTVRKSGTTSNGKKIAYTIPKGASKCCYWQICFYWNEGDDLASGMSYDCTKCYKFYVCPKTTCDVYVKIDDPCCVGYKLYVDGKYLFTEGGDGTTPDGYCAFDVSAGKHTLKITKNGRSASKTIYFECNIVYRWVSMPKNWCGDGEAYVEIKDKYCKGYKVYVDDVYQFTEGQSGTPNGNCAFHVTDGTHTLKITKNGRSASITKYFECGATYHWVSMPDNWCNPCADPPTATFDKQKYNEGDTMHATVSTSSGSVNYKIKDCGGNIRKSGDISNGGMISYTIPTGASECCNWQICFYWGKGGSDIGPLDAGGKLTAQSYECTKCYDFYVCPGEKPAPEIIKVEYPTTCVKEGEDATISVTVKNNGGASSEGYISVSFPNDEQIYDVSGTGGTYNKLYPKGSRIWNNKDQQMESVDPLVELLDTNWGKGQQETITMNVKPDSGSDEIVFYVRAALKNADGTYERDPTYSGYTDQQGWYVKNYAIGVCPKEACVIIDDDTCVGYKVCVDGAYQLTEGVGETLDGYCTFYVAGGTNTVEIRDNECFAYITRNFERGSTYRWDSMPKNWCKCNAAVKFRGVIIKETHPISFYNCKIKIDEILMDPSGVLDSGDEIWIWAFGTGPAQVDVVSIGDTVEVYGKYDGEPQRQVKLETGEHYLKNLEKQEIKFNGTATDYFERIGAGGWNVTVDEIISGPSELEGHTVSVALWSVNPEEYPPGYIEDTIEPGDSVKVYGLYAGEDAVTLSGSKDYYLTKDYETEEGYKWITIGEVTTFDCCDTKDYFEVSTHADWLTECLKIKASTGECLQGHGFVSWGPDSDCWKTGCLMEDLTFLDASKGMIELWTQEWDPNRGAGGAYSGAVKVRYRITCYDPPKNKLDRKAWIPAAVDTVRLGFGEKDFWVYISGVKSESSHTTLFLWGGAEPGYPRTPASYEDKIDVGDVKEGDSFELEVPSGKIMYYNK